MPGRPRYPGQPAIRPAAGRSIIRALARTRKRRKELPPCSTATIQPVFTDAERIALAGYRGVTREAYALDLRQFTTWCGGGFLALFAVRRAGIVGFAWDLDAGGRARATVTGGCPPSPGPASTRSKKKSPAPRLPRTCAGHEWTTSPMPSPWTAANSVPCWSPPGSSRRLAQRSASAGVSGSAHLVPPNGVALRTKRGHPKTAVLIPTCICMQ